VQEVCFTMQQNFTLNETVREAIALALIQLMKRKPLTRISISEIVKVAGVSRSSFYRNFESKEDILNSHMGNLYRNFFRTQNISLHAEKLPDISRFLLPRFQFIKQHRDFFTVLAQNNLLYNIFEQMDPELRLLLMGQNSSISCYYLAMFSGSCASVIHMWIHNNFRESEEEMVEIFAAYPR